MSLFKQSLSKQTAILSYYPEASLIVSSTGDVIYANKPAESILNTENITGKNFTDLFSVSFETMISSHNHKNILKIKTATLEEKIVEIKLTKIDKEENYVVSVNDVTKAHFIIQTLLEEQNNQDKINHQKNNLLVKISNNITSPLHSIIGFSQAILEGLGGEINEKQEKYLNIIHKNSSELLFLVEKVIELSQIEANLFEPHYKNFDITTTLSSVASENKYLLDEKKLQLEINTELLERKNCYSDESALKNIISNLLKNAIMSCDLGTISINISTPQQELLIEKEIEIPEMTNEKSFVLVEVVDNGVGIPSNEMQDLFDPYLQADKPVKKNLIKGFILGISQKLIESLNGKIWVESEIMKGSKYSFIVPIEKLTQQNPSTIDGEQATFINEE